MKLTKYEKETIILFNEAEDQVDVFTYNVNLKRRLANFSRKYPELCRKKAVNKEGGVTYLILIKVDCPFIWCHRMMRRRLKW